MASRSVRWLPLRCINTSLPLSSATCSVFLTVQRIQREQLPLKSQVLNQLLCRCNFPALFAINQCHLAEHQALIGGKRGHPLQHAHIGKANAALAQPPADPGQTESLAGQYVPAPGARTVPRGFCSHSKRTLMKRAIARYESAPAATARMQHSSTCGRSYILPCPRLLSSISSSSFSLNIAPSFSISGPVFSALNSPGAAPLRTNERPFAQRDCLWQLRI
jgi:hypothetical protein